MKKLKNIKDKLSKYGGPIDWIMYILSIIIIALNISAYLSKHTPSRMYYLLVAGAWALILMQDIHMGKR